MLYRERVMRDRLRADVVVTFHGVRGSTPCSCPTLARYGGNTSCISVESEGQDPIIFDLGTGLRTFGTCRDGGEMTAHALLTHLHWDHVQGLPFFEPLHNPHSSLTVYGPGDGSAESLADCMARFMAPPFFPITASDLPASVSFIDTLDADFSIGETSVMARSVPHTGPTAGFRIERNGLSIAYLPDHQEPLDDKTYVAPGARELCRGVDVLIHDAQLTTAEFAEKAHWGHSTPAYALEVARQAGAKTLVLFHHDPSHDDEAVDVICEETRRLAEADGIDVVAALEGLKLTLPAPTGATT